MQHSRASARLTEPLVAKQGSLFLLSTDAGDVQADTDQGLYFHDMRYISAETLRLNDSSPVSLLADASEGNHALFELTNADLGDDSGELRVHKESLGIRREKCLGDDYAQVITIQNYTSELAEFCLRLHYEADFADMFVVRGMHPGKRGKLHAPRWRGATLTFRYDGADKHQRTTKLHFSHPPAEHHTGDLEYRLSLKAQQVWQLKVSCQLHDGQGSSQLESSPHAAEGTGATDIQRAQAGALGPGAQVETSNALFNEIVTRSFLDLHMLRMRQEDQIFFAAGVPWYVALFGRDSLVTSIETAAFEPEIGANTLRVLARHQGTQVDDWRDEQPGKILHEFRVDELANLGEIPQTPYYGSVDSTPLFLVLLGIYSAWTGSLDLFHELHGNVCSALAWIDQFGDSDGDGFIDYQTHSKLGARNQGWKDSGNGIVMEDGQLGEPPIALPEVQGYAYLAWSSMAELFERDGDSATAERLRNKAQRLYSAFNREFWLADERYYAFCRQADGRFSKSIASNAAHTLWTGIVDPKHARAVVRRVLQSDMFSGWGVRTLSALHPAYNPVDYQVGSVWPHDNAIIVAGMQRHGFDKEANQVFTAMMQAASKFEHFRLPEVFAGYERGVASKPVKYPVACNPQAWAAGSIPYMLASMLGLQPDAFNRILHVQHPHLPDWLRWVTLSHLRVGDAEVDLRYERSDHGTLVAVTRKRGDL
ncbi:MAG: amylo-alpha-1,6-glucosidase, partial [Chloroflexota bacterium]|nr:amylo-alpha-1,6-glucosidase [Chloroflexota bacterium]